LPFGDLELIRTPSHSCHLLLPSILLLLTTGCRDDSARVAAVAHHALESQAEQNKELARLSGDVVESSQQLVEQDAQARTAILAAQQNLQSQHSDLSDQRDDLEHDRRSIATQRQTESLLAPILMTLGTALLCLLPLGLAAYALFLSRGTVPEMADVGQILLDELMSETPKLLPPLSPSVPRLDPPAEEPVG
jgi:ABC-type transporter Mla subunit MlaD